MNTSFLNEILENSLFPWWEWNIKKNIVTFNKLKVTILGYTVKDFVGCDYQAFTNLLHPEDHPKAMTAMMNVLYGKEQLYQIDYRIKNSNNQYQWFIDRGYVMTKDEQGKPEVIRGIVVSLGCEHERIEDADAIIQLMNNSKKYYEKAGVSMITLCSNCFSIRKTRTEWLQIDTNIVKLLGEKISHSICPKCIKKLYPDLAPKIFMEISSQD